MTLEGNQIQALMDSFEGRKKSHQGNEVWGARDLMNLFGYKSWQKFRNVMFRAMNAMEKAGANPDDHFIQVDEMFIGANESNRYRENYWMSRAGAHMLALETSTVEYEAAAFARVYFSTQTRRMELLEPLIREIEKEQHDVLRVEARQKLVIEEKGLGETLWNHGVDQAGLISIKQQGNIALFGGKNTEDMRWKLGIGGTKRAIADFISTPVILAKALIASLTQKKVNEENQWGTLAIGPTHVQHSQNVRKALLESGVVPENSGPEEDIKLVEKRLSARKKIGVRNQLIAHPIVSAVEPRPVAQKERIEAIQPRLFDDM